MPFELGWHGNNHTELLKVSVLVLFQVNTSIMVS